MPIEKYVFISYSSAELDTATQVRQVLAENGINSWMAPQSIPGGSDYTKSIPDAISNCSAVVLICSAISQDSYWVKSEIIEAINCKKTIIPYIIDESPMKKEFNFLLSPAHRILAYQNKESSYFALVNSIKAVIQSEDEIEAHNESTAEQISAVKRDPDADKAAVIDTPKVISKQPAAETAPQIPDPVIPPAPQPPIPPVPAVPVQPDNQVINPEPNVGKARIVRSEIKILPTLITWAVFALSAVFCIVNFASANTSSEKIISTYFQVILIFNILLFPLPLIMMNVVKTTKFTTPSSINKTRWLVALLYITFTAICYLLFVINAFCFDYHMFNYEVYQVFPYFLAVLILFFAVIALTIICVVKFKKGKPFLWFKNIEGPAAAYSIVPNTIILIINYLFYFIALEESFSQTSLSGNNNLMSIASLPLFTIPMLAVSLICLLIVRKHTTAPRKTVQLIRWIIAALNIAYILYAIVISLAYDTIHVFGGWYSYELTSLAMLIPAAIVLVATFVLTIVFRRTKYVYE